MKAFKTEIAAVMCAAVFLILACFCGCVRLAGTAGVATLGSGDEEPKVRQVGFDTANVLK
ncbi:MAG: hypothetical protein WC352_06855 [Candidatus Omnitrophota bacterium]|jgi:hypothetical protein